MITMNPFLKFRLSFYLKTASITLGIILLITIIGNWIVMPLYVSQRDILKVPDFSSQKREDAVKQITDLGLQPIITVAPFDPKIEPGVVVAQNPLVGTEVKVGRRIYLSVTGTEALKTTVPDLVGKSEREAVIMLDRFRLRKGSIIYEESTEFPESVVMSQTISPETRVKEGTMITLVVSRGGAKDLVVIPNLINLSLNEAQKMILKQGLSTGKINEQFSEDILPNTVVDQFPKAEERVPQGKQIDLWVIKRGKPGTEKSDSN